MTILRSTRSIPAALAVLGASLCFLAPSAALAASQHECEIWLCLPGGFGPSECNPAKQAMHKRIKHGHSPLPDFAACSIKDDSAGLSYQQRVDTHVPEQEICSQWAMRGEFEQCVAWRKVEEHWAEGQYCREGTVSSSAGWFGNGGGGKNALRCDGSARAITIFQRGEQLGDTFRY